jgi:hypothetical protein
LFGLLIQRQRVSVAAVPFPGDNQGAGGFQALKLKLYPAARQADGPGQVILVRRLPGLQEPA